MPFIMRLLRLPLLPRATLAWLVALALLLPVAQFAAVWHGYTHVAPQTSPEDAHRSLPSLAHCDLCLTVASLDNSGPPLFATALRLAPPSSDAAPAANVTGVAAAPALLAYLSRAPPITQR
jgi:hypothetical protein